MLLKKITLPALYLLLAQSAVAKPVEFEAVKGGAMNIISFAPLVLFLFIIILIFYILKREGYKIGDALKENETLNISEDNPALEKPVAIKRAADGSPAAQVPAGQPVVAPPPTAPPFVEKTVQPKSSSRLLAFISGIITVGLASCLCSFWIYRYFQCDQSVELSELSNVLLALGLGVVPYAVNKVSGALSENK
jgi:hypothetical protein